MNIIVMEAGMGVTQIVFGVSRVIDSLRLKLYSDNIHPTHTHLVR